MISLNRYSTYLLGLLAGLLIIAGCDQSSFTGSESVSSGQRATATASKNSNGSSGGLSSTTRFKLDLEAKGPLKPGKSVQVAVKVHAQLPTNQANVKLVLPSVAALQKSQGSRHAVLATGKPIPAQGSWNQEIGQNQTLQRRSTVQIEEPGYYQVVASAVAQSGDIQTKNGRWIQNSTSRDLWLWIDEDGGRVTEEFDRGLFPENARKQPGPLTLKNELPKIGVASQSSGAKVQTHSSSETTTIEVRYRNQTSSFLKPLEGARVRYSVRDWRGIERFSGTKVIGNNGRVAIPCYLKDPRGTATYSGTVHVQDNYRLRVYHPQTGSDVTGYFSGEVNTDCGQVIPVRAAFKMAHVFMRMSETIGNSRSLFQKERGKMHTHLKWDVENSSYCGPQPFPGISPWCGSGNRDHIAIMDSPDPEGETHVGGDFGDYTVAHEYGHALQDARLGGLPGDFNGYNCPSPHNISGAYNLECAYFEGFADYHGAATVEDLDYSGNRYKDRTENNSFYPGNYGSGDRSDGAIIEGAVAAFLYDLTDPANEPHDNVEYPGSYVADIIRTCKVDGDPADGIDHLIACFQREIPSYSGYFDTRGNSPSSFSESASEPSGWNRTDIIKLWRKNLYGEDYDGSPPPPSLSVNLSGPSILDEGEYGTWTASPSGGNGSYDYSWEVRQSSSSSWYSTCGNSSSCSWGKDLINQSLTARIRVTVSSGGESGVASKSFIVNNNGGGGGCNDGVTTNRICL